MKKWKHWLFLALLYGVSFAVGIMLAKVHARESYPGQYAQYDAEDRAWFQKQVSPKSGTACCSTADGTYAEERIEYDEAGKGHYWTKFVAKMNVYVNGKEEQQDFPVDWMQVPDDVVITTPNKHGAPTVWWIYNAVTKTFTIRCYAVGAKS